MEEIFMTVYNNIRTEAIIVSCVTVGITILTFIYAKVSEIYIYKRARKPSLIRKNKKHVKVN